MQNLGDDELAKLNQSNQAKVDIRHALGSKVKKQPAKGRAPLSNPSIITNLLKDNKVKHTDAKMALETKVAKINAERAANKQQGESAARK